MCMIGGLEHHRNADLRYIRWREAAIVLDLQNIGTELGNYSEQRSERPGVVLQLDREAVHTPRRSKPTLDDSRDHVQIDVAAAEDGSHLAALQRLGPFQSV